MAAAGKQVPQVQITSTKPYDISVGPIAVAIDQLPDACVLNQLFGNTASGVPCWM